MLNWLPVGSHQNNMNHMVMFKCCIHDSGNQGCDEWLNGWVSRACQARNTRDLSDKSIQIWIEFGMWLTWDRFEFDLGGFMWYCIILGPGVIDFQVIWYSAVDIKYLGFITVFLGRKMKPCACLQANQNHRHTRIFRKKQEFLLFSQN